MDYARQATVVLLFLISRAFVSCLDQESDANRWSNGTSSAKDDESDVDLETDHVDDELTNEPDLVERGIKDLWIASMVLIIIFSVSGNGLITYAVFRYKTLRRPCFFFLFNIALADLVRSLVCFPFVITSVVASDWVYGKFLCEILAFFNVYLPYGSLYTLCLISIERYVVLRWHRFHRQKLKGLGSLLCVLSAWALAVSTAFPPVFNFEAYGYIPTEHQCTFRHRSINRANDTLLFLLFFVLVTALIHVFYLRVFFFMRAHRRMRPLEFIPAVSSTWTFYGPGSTGQAAANWFQGFRQGPTPPPLVGLAPPSVRGEPTVPSADFHQEEKVTRLTFSISVAHGVMWSPYIIYSFLKVFRANLQLPIAFVSIATWLTFLQVCVNPILCMVHVPEVRRCVLAASSSDDVERRNRDQRNGVI